MNQITPPSLSDALRNVSLVVELNMTSLGLSRTDQRASQDTTQTHQAVRGSARVVVSRLAGVDDLHRQLVRVQTAMREALNTRSMPWGPGGRRLLPTAQFEPWVREHAALDAEHKKHHDELVARAPQIIQQAAQNLGQFDIEPPTLEEIQQAYTVAYSLENVPTADFGGALGDAANDWLKYQFERNVAAAYADAQADALSRLAAPMTNLVDRLKAFDERVAAQERGDNPGKTGIFRDSLVSNVQDVVSALRSFNLPGDPRLDQLNRHMEAFMDLTPDKLRGDAALREATRMRAESVMAQVDDWLGPIHAV